MVIEPLSEGYYYHIYNRGINGENIFNREENYRYFLHQYQYYLSDAVDTYCYILLKNHFHLLVFVKENIEVERKDGKGFIRLDASKQFSHFFNSYAQAFNKMYKRTGGLFESPFHRKQIKEDIYFTRLVYYIHTNAQKHGFVQDFREWNHSSYKTVISDYETFLKREELLKWFNGKGEFEKFHLSDQSFS
ncbi:MAG: hypothetical protein HY252_09330 [Sphingobacteriales bacterium]|nr:hypothetical protein [Sphingobacteriales bacterium]